MARAALQAPVLGRAVVHVRRQLGPVLQEPPHPLAEPGEPVHLAVAEHLGREQRDEPHRAPDAQGDALPVDDQLVVIEAIGLVPEPLAAQRVHRVDDGHEVLEELAGDVLEGVVHLRQLQRDAQHRGAEEPIHAVPSAWVS
jgi:hypothetical protein